MKIAHLAAGGALAAVLGGAAYWINYDKWIVLPAARKNIATQLRDPDATQFKNDRLTRFGWLCGELNAKNGAGGYDGFRRFVSGGREGDYYIEGQGQVGKLSAGESTDRVLAMMDHEIRLMKEFNDLKERMPDFNVPSRSEIKVRAEAAYFEAKWKEICE